MLSNIGFIISFSVCVFIHINSKEIDLIANLNQSANVKGIIKHGTLDNGKSIWFLNLTDENSRQLMLTRNTTMEIQQLLIDEKDFEICVVLNQNEDNSGTIFTISNNKSVRFLEIKVSLKKNIIRIIYSPDRVLRGSFIEKIEYVSHKNPWHSICFEYTSHNTQFTMVVDCDNKVQRNFRYGFPYNKLKDTNINDLKIWIGQRNSGRSYFKGIIKQMIFSTNINLSTTYCASLIQQAISIPLTEITNIESISTRLNIIENEFMNIKMKFLESENKVKDMNKCQCFPSCIAFNGETKSYDETWQENPCVNCTCTLKGKLCYERKCPNLTCSLKITEPGQCCQRCGKNCQYRGRNYFHMENFSINCTKCQCNDGSMACVQINPKLECPKLTCSKFHQTRKKGTCCKICKKINFCDFNNCGANAICVPSSQYGCQCKPGFEGDPYRSCEDIDECRNLNSCPASAKCINTIGSFLCICKSGYIKMDSSAIDCQAICIKNKCKNNSTCIAPEKCECTAGYSGEQCDIDINECKLGLVKCPENSECLNIPGSYICRCVNGYKTSRNSVMSVYYDHQCKDIDECEGPRGVDHFCGTSSICMNTVGGYNCISTSRRNNCEIVNLNKESIIVENGVLFIQLEACMNCNCINGNLYCTSMNCDCSANFPKSCCRKCYSNECKSSIAAVANDLKLQNFDCMSTNTTCPNLECPKASCHDQISIPGQCCTLCRSDPITSCLLNYNNYHDSMSSFNHLISSCFYNDKRYESGDRFVFQNHADGSCTKCLCWNHYFCCAKSFNCRS